MVIVFSRRFYLNQSSSMVTVIVFSRHFYLNQSSSMVIVFSQRLWNDPNVNIDSPLCFLLTPLMFQGNSFMVSSYKGQLLRVGVDVFGKLQQRPLQQGQGVLSGLGRRVSSLFGMSATPTDVTVSLPAFSIFVVFIRPQCYTTDTWC